MDLRKNKLSTLQIAMLLGVSLLLRIVDLGYSNFQGDEISTLCRFSKFQTPIQFLAYLLGQRKGPIQYLVTCAFSIFDPTFSSELALRLPFAVANLIALVCFFILVYRLFTLQVAIYSSFLFATNGIFIAFARIVQYQSFVILGVVTGILGLTYALQYEKWRVPGLYVGFISAAIGLLAHFDTAFVVPPMAVLVVHWWRKFHKQPDFARLLRHLIAAATLFAFLVLTFYIEYFLRLGPYQTDYWGERLTGESTNILSVFQFYNPGPILWICLGSVAIGLTQIRKSIGWQVTLAWLLPPLIFMVVVFKDSRTHAYTYLLPLLIVAGMGIDAVIGWLHPLLRGKSIQIAHAIALAVFLIFAYLSYSIFIDHDPEYPWYPKRILNIELNGGYLAGTFGFPYSREWRGIAKWFDDLPGQDVVLVTNEKLEIATFYLPSKVHYKYIFSESPGKVQASHGIYFLLIKGPQSWMNQLWGWPLDQWHEKLTPVHEFVNEEGKIVASIYFLTQEKIDTEFH
ncbi:MAG TPA: glycosyltransferase family 39 protein [Anaerolineales bacterium]|nr:glycosyltransferase family 39 protein [Anaerolineales bacterium]